VTFGDEKLIVSNGIGGPLFLYYEDINKVSMDVTQPLADIMAFELSGGGDGVQLLIFPHGSCFSIVTRLENKMHPAAAVFERQLHENCIIGRDDSSAIQRLLGSSTSRVLVYSPDVHTEIVITYADMTRLLPDQPLNDSILDSYCKLLSSSLCADMSERVFMFGIYFFKKLVSTAIETSINCSPVKNYGEIGA
jgi:hypothetical protein